MVTPQMFVKLVSSGAQLQAQIVGSDDSSAWSLGDDGDVVFFLRSTALGANTALSGVLVGTPVTPALAADSAIISNTTEDGDILFAVRDGDHSKGLLHLDGSAGSVTIVDNLTFDGSTLTVTGDAVITDDLTLNSDSAVFNMGDDSGFSITHDGDLGATIAGSPITITSAEGATWSTSSGKLSLSSGSGTIDMTSDILDNVSGIISDIDTGLMRDKTDGLLLITGGTSWADGGYIRIYGESHSSKPGAFEISTTVASAGNATIRLHFPGDAATIAATFTAVNAMSFDQATTISTTAGNLTLEAYTGADVLIGDNATILYVDGGQGNVGINASSSGSQASLLVEQRPAPTTSSSTIVGAIHTGGGNVAVTDQSGDYRSISFARHALTTASGTPTIPVASTVLIDGAITAGSNVTITDSFALNVTGGTSTFGVVTKQNVSAGGAILAAGGIAFTDVANAWIDDATQGSGTVTHYIGNQSITTSSDERLKTDIRPTAIDALSMVDEFKVVDFGWDDPTDTVKYGKNYRGRYTGMIAQDTVKIAPWIINDQGGGRDCNQCMSGDECDEHGMWQVEYQHLVPTLVKAIQELSEKIQELEHGNR